MSRRAVFTILALIALCVVLLAVRNARAQAPVPHVLIATYRGNTQ